MTRDNYVKHNGCVGGKTKLYRVWCTMKERCNNPHNKSYSHYGGRGIKVCDEWVHDFDAFRCWANQNGYQEGLTIDRINVDGMYEPNNCRWVDYKTQNRNYSRNVNVTIDGETKCVKDWAESVGLNPSTIMWRIKHGIKGRDLISKEMHRRRKVCETGLQN